MEVKVETSIADNISISLREALTLFDTSVESSMGV